MKLTKSKLNQIVKEEYSKVLNEAYSIPDEFQQVADAIGGQAEQDQDQQIIIYVDASWDGKLPETDLDLSRMSLERDNDGNQIIYTGYYADEYTGAEGSGVTSGEMRP